MNSLRWDFRLARKMMRDKRVVENVQEFKKLLKIFGLCLLIVLAFIGLMTIIQAIPKG